MHEFPSAFGFGIFAARGASLRLSARISNDSQSRRRACDEYGVRARIYRVKISCIADCRMRRADFVFHRIDHALFQPNSRVGSLSRVSLVRSRLSILLYVIRLYLL